jgi:uncharacterized membrane protein
MSDAAAIEPTIPMGLHDLRKLRKPLRNVHKETVENLSTMDRLAVWITERVGTMGFFLLIMAWTVFWLGWNTLLPQSMRFDPAMGFVLYLFLCNVIQILLMPLIMVGQNIQGKHSEARAEHDLEVNVKAEQEIEVVLRHLEHQNEVLLNQNNLLLQMMRGLKLDIQTMGETSA